MQDDERNALLAITDEAVVLSLTAKMRRAIQEGIDSGPAIPAEQLFAYLRSRYAEPESRPL